METIVLESFKQIKDKFASISNQNSNKYTFLRGTKEEKLLPSIVPRDNCLSVKQLVQIEKNLLRVFKIITPDNKIKNYDAVTQDWLYRIKAREHELGSRLMDWSNALGKSLDFATSIKTIEAKDQFVYLWILLIEENELIHFEDLKEKPIDKISNSSIIRNDLRYNMREGNISWDRQFIQGGSFFIQSESLLTTPLNEQDGLTDKLICIKIPSHSIESIRKDLGADEKLDRPLMITENNNLDNICKALNQYLLYDYNSEMQSNNA